MQNIYDQLHVKLLASIIDTRCDDDEVLSRIVEMKAVYNLLEYLLSFACTSS